MSEATSTHALWVLLIGAAVLLAAFLGAGLPALLTTDVSRALLIGSSMIPRAEIAMIIAQQGRSSGIVPETAQAALLFVTAATCVVATWLVHSLLMLWPQHVSRKERLA